MITIGEIDIGILVVFILLSIAVVLLLIDMIRDWL